MQSLKRFFAEHYRPLKGLSAAQPRGMPRGVKVLFFAQQAPRESKKTGAETRAQAI